MKNFSDKYLQWYEQNRLLINKISVFNVVLFMMLIIIMFITDHELLNIIVWLWGLSIASLVVNWFK